MQSPVADLRYCARDLRKRPGIALTAILSLVVGQPGPTTASPYTGPEIDQVRHLKRLGRPLDD